MKCVAPRRRTASTSSAPARQIRTGPTGTPVTWWPRRPGQSCRSKRTRDCRGPKAGANSERRNIMKGIGYLLCAVVALVGMVAYMPHASGQPDGESSPIDGVKISAGFRDWEVDHVDILV